MKTPEIAATKSVMTAVTATIALLMVTGTAAAWSVSKSDAGTTRRAKVSAHSPTTPASAPAPGTKATKAKGGATVDACSLVTPAEAATAFGADPGAAHVVLGACLYDNGSHKLIVALIHSGAQAQFNADRGTASKNVAGVGDAAYLRDGRLRVLKGFTMMEITIVPADPSGASPALVALGKAAAARL